MYARHRLSVVLLVAMLCCSTKSNYERLEDPQILAIRSSSSPAVINFWATWCEPCVTEIPILNRLHEKYQSVRVVGINVDDVENRGAIPGFLKNHPIEYEIVLREGKDFKSLASAIDPEWNQGLPATFVFKNGKRIFSKRGLLQENELDDVLRRIAK